VEVEPGRCTSDPDPVSEPSILTYAPLDGEGRVLSVVSVPLETDEPIIIAPGRNPS
jgi:hypothetical protein